MVGSALSKRLTEDFESIRLRFGRLARRSRATSPPGPLCGVPAPSSRPSLSLPGPRRRPGSRGHFSAGATLGRHGLGGQRCWHDRGISDRRVRQATGGDFFGDTTFDLLGTLDLEESGAADINESGVIVGRAFGIIGGKLVEKVFVYEGGGTRDLLTLLPE
jgi:hypothetical protein